MKKLLSLLLVMCTLLSLVSCKDKKSSKKSGKNDDDEITFTEMVAVDNEECLIKITGITNDKYDGYNLKVLLENKSDDKSYTFSVHSAAINGVQCSAYLYSSVSAGKKANEVISFTEDDLKANGIKTYTDIELTFQVYDSDDWMADDIVNETVHIYPYGEDKVTQYVRAGKESDNIVVDNEYVTLTVIGYEYDDIWGYTVKLFLVNKTEERLMFSVEDASVNGFMADPSYAQLVSAGKCAFGSMSWYDSTLEDNGITKVEEIEFNLRVYDYDDWYDFVNTKVTLNP